MELCGEDVSQYESPVSFYRLKKPPPQKFGTAPETSLMEPPHSANLIDLAEQIPNPGCDPPPDNIPFPDRLGRQIKFWESIHAPAHILKALEEGVDIGLVDDIESVLPTNGINKQNMKWESPAHLSTCQSLVKELTARGITGKRSTRARINLGIFLITKPNGKHRFIWNGKALSPYLKKTDFSYELLQRFLDGITDGSYLGKLDLVDGFFALKVKPSQRQYLGFTLVNEFGVDEYYEFLVLPQGISTAPYIFSRFTLAITSYLRRTLTMVLFITYLDDLGWAISPWCPPLERIRIMNFIRDTFLNAGWMLSATKCIFDINITTLLARSKDIHSYRLIISAEDPTAMPPSSDPLKVDTIPHSLLC